MRDAVHGPRPMGARRLLALATHLPPEAVSRDQPEWTRGDELAAFGVETTWEVVRAVLGLMRMWIGNDRDRRAFTIPDSLHVPRPEGVELARQAVAAPAVEHEWPPRLRARSAREFAMGLSGKLQERVVSRG